MVTFVSGHVFALFSFIHGNLFQLFRARNPAFRDTNTVLNRLIILTVETGMATALATLVEIILLVGSSHNNLHFLVCVNTHSFVTSTN